MFYVAQSESLAILEVFVHLERKEVLNKYRLISLEFDQKHVKPYTPDSQALKDKWNTPKPGVLSQQYGERFRERFLAVQVRSVFSLSEWSYVINPYHKDFNQVKIGRAERFNFNPRMIK